MEEKTKNMWKQLVASPAREIIMALVFILSLTYAYGGSRAKEELMHGVIQGHTEELRQLTIAMEDLRVTVVRLDERLKAEQELREREVSIELTRRGLLEKKYILERK